MSVVFGILGFLALAVLVTCYICFRMAFYAPRKPESEAFSLPDGDIYEAYREPMTAWANQVRQMPHEDMEIVSFDALVLRGKFYEYAPGAPIELMFHGYRGKAERDLCGGVQRCFALGRSALLVDQRSCGRSEGRVITFGIREYRDCLSWLTFMEQRFGKERNIILCGISMGAATVLIAAGQPLPSNVVGVLADCGYTSAKEIIQKTIHDMKLPARPLYPLVRLGAKLFGGFDPDEFSPIQAVKNCKVPVIFFHGDADDYVPYAMQEVLFNACASSKKKQVSIPNAKYESCYVLASDVYEKEVRKFLEA